MISIITPTYNEAKNISDLVKLIGKAMHGLDYEIIITDDNSPDKTALIAKSMSKKYNISLLVSKKRIGISKSILKALEYAQGDIIAVIDADLSHNPKYIPEMVNALNKKDADIVIGSRYVKNAKINDWPAKRKLLSFLAASIVRPLASVKDPLSGFFVIRKKLLNNMSLKPKSCKILLEILCNVHLKKIVEYPIIFKNRHAGKSKMRLTEVLRFLNHASSLYLSKIRKSL